MDLRTLQCVWIIMMAYYDTSTGSYELGWSSWSSCSVSCGVGVKHKTRTCIIPSCPEKEMTRTLTSQCYNPCPTDSKPKNVSDAQPTIPIKETLSPFNKEKPTKRAKTTRKMISKHAKPTIWFTNRRKRSPRKQKTPKMSKPTTATKVSTPITSVNKPTVRSTSTNMNKSSKQKPTSSQSTNKRPKSLSAISATTTTTISSTINGETTRPTLQTTSKHIKPKSKSPVTYSDHQSMTLKVTASRTLPSEHHPTLNRKTNFKKSTVSKPTRKNTPSPKIATNGEGTCLSEEHKHIWWPRTKAGEIAIRPCPPNSKGNASRVCLKEGKAKWDRVNLAKCVSTKFLKIQEKLKELQSCGNRSHPKCIVRSSYREVIESLKNETAPKDNTTRLNGGDLVISINSLASIHNTSQEFNTETNKAFVDVVSNLLSTNNVDTWRQTQKEYRRNLALEVVALMENIGFSISTNLSSKSNGSILISARNVVMKVDDIDQQKLKFKQKDIYSKFSNTSVQVPVQELFESNSSKLVTIIYLTLNHVLQFGINSKRLLNKQRSITTIVSSSVLPRYRRWFKRPVKIVMKNSEYYPKGGANITCVSWTSGSKKGWSLDGCRLVPEESGQDFTTCICYHMTLFAALMDPYGIKIPKEHRFGLEIISLVGCSISLIAVAATVAITLFHWKKLKSPRSEILLNMCLAIGVVCILVIIENPAREYKAMCSIIATLLHFFLLSIFSWMLCEGLLLRLVFFSDITGSGRSKLKQFYILGWGFPAMVVSISVAATRMKGYGEKNVLCWLSTKNGLSFAFVAPAVFIVLVNIWILVLTMRRMLRIRQIRNKPRVERVRLGLRATLVILPLLGVTWLFGLLAFDSNTIVFKYLFAVFNSLQGVFIFIFHCVLDHKVKEAINNKKRRRQSMAMSVTRVRPVGRDRRNSNPSTPVKMFSFAKTSVKKDFNKQWDDAWNHQKTHVTKIVHLQENTASASCCPRSLKMSSLVFEMTVEEHKQAISNQDDIL